MPLCCFLSGLRIAIVTTRWNVAVVESLQRCCVETLTRHGVVAADISLCTVPGAFELPFACKSLILRSRASSSPLQAVVALGCLVKGDTPHFEYISSSCTAGIGQVGLETGVPVVMGVLTCLTEEQARQRSGLQAGGHNHGEDYALAAMDMAQLAFTPPAL
jgi:6,7-dimethyl-8-ribityllumazine synthase